MDFLANWIVYGIFHMPQGNRLTEALHFFISDTSKIFLMLVGIIYVVSYIRSYFPPERAKKLLGHKREFMGNIMAALLGIVTPFCSCSAVPVFIGFLEAGVPLGVTFSFLISSPMVNEVALVMLLGLFGWKIALLYIGTGLLVALVGGFAIGRLKLEHQVEDYVYQIRMGETAATANQTFAERHQYAWDYTRDTFKKVWLYVLLGVAIGGFIHGYAPEDLLAKYAGRGNWFAVPLAVLIGVPLYSNATGTLPIVNALMEKGMPIGTVLAFMMSVTALSFPEFIILRKVIKPKLIGIYIAIVSVSIIAVGYIFNLVLA